MVGDANMIIKQFHCKELITLIFVQIILILIIIDIFISDKNEAFVFIIILYIIAQSIGIYSLAYELRMFLVSNIGICVRWFGIIPYFFRWEEIRVASIEPVKFRYLEYNAIIISKIPIRRFEVPYGSKSYAKYVNYEWLSNRPNKVIAIYIDDLKPGQYEEFWSYVPERLKGNF